MKGRKEIVKPQLAMLAPGGQFHRYKDGEISFLDRSQVVQSIASFCQGLVGIPEEEWIQIATEIYTDYLNRDLYLKNQKDKETNEKNNSTSDIKPEENTDSKVRK